MAENELRKSFDLHKALDEILECALCLETLADPKYLPCHHYLCAKCLQELIENSDSKSNIKCPTCRTQVDINSENVQAFPAAFLINKLKDVALQGKKGNVAETKIPVNERSTNPVELVCSSVKHHPQPVVLFCEPCQDLVCETCCKEEHKGHSKNNFSEVVETHRTILSENNTSFEMRLRDYAAKQEHLSKAKDNFQDTVESHNDHVKNQGDKIIEKVQAAVFKIQQNLKQESEKIMKEFEEQRMTISRDVDELTATKKEIKLSLTQDNTAEIIYKSVKEGPAYRKQLSLLKADQKIPRNRVTLQLTDLNLLTDSTLVGEMYLDSISVANSTDTTSISSLTEDQVFFPSTNAADGKKGDKAMTKPALFKDTTAEPIVKKTIQFPINYYASGVTCTPDEKIAVCGYSWPDKTRIYHMDGQEIGTIQSPTFMKKMFSFAMSCEVWDVACSRYNLYLTDNSSGQVYMFSFDGTHVNTIPVGYKGKAGIALTDDYIYVTSQKENVVYRLHMPAGEKKEVFIQDDEDISQPTFVAANDRYVAVSSNGNHRVFMYNSEGRRQFEYGRFGVEAGKLNHPWGVLIDSTDRLIISDASNNRICFVSSGGQHIMDIDLTKHNLEFPRGLAFTHTGQMVVACKTAVAVFKIEYGFN